jgi:PAS domain S-box-containing protein
LEPGHPNLDLDFLATVFDVARIGICVVDGAGRFVRVNPAFCSLVDYRSDELIGQHYSICAPPSVVEAKDRFLAALLTDSPKIPSEWMIRRKDGSLFDALVSFRPITRPDGGQFVVITFSDITESKRAQAQIEAFNREKYRRVINLTKEGFWLINARNETIEVNAALCRMLGYREDEMLGRTPLDFVDDRYRHVLERRLVPVPKPAEATYESLLVRKDGTRLPAAYNATAVMNAQGEREFSFAFITDITERKLLEESLRQTLSEQNAILQSSVVGIAFLRHSDFMWVNKAFEQDMLGYAEGELVGKSSERTYPSGDVFRAMGPETNAALAGHGVYQTEGRVRRKDGTLVWCLVSGRAIDPHNVPVGSIWTIVDISQRKAAEAELLQALAREKELNELRSRFVSMTSHEFRTPLAAIMSSIELLADYADQLPKDEKAELAGVIKSSVRRMTGMLENILVIGKSEAGRLEFRPAVIDLHALCVLAIEDARAAVGDEHEFVLAREQAHTAHYLDENLLRHILNNLLSNAAKYSEPGSRIDLELASEEGAVVIHVTDQGIGIPPQDLPGLFQTFHRGSNVGTIAGTGLGLAIVKKAVDLHGGSIGVDSMLNKGTRFTVTLPEIAPASHG